MSKIGLDAVSLGNRDIRLGMEVLARYITSIKVPVLCANLDISYVPQLHNISNLKKWEIFRYPEKNMSVGVIGFLSPRSPNINELKILPLAKSIK